MARSMAWCIQDMDVKITQPYRSAPGNGNVDRGNLVAFSARTDDDGIGGGSDLFVSARVIGMPVRVPNLGDPPPQFLCLFKHRRRNGRIHDDDLASGLMSPQVFRDYAERGNTFRQAFHDLSLQGAA